MPATLKPISSPSKTVNKKKKKADLSKNKLVKDSFNRKHNTPNESYNRPPYILAASAENKNKKSMFFIL